jgi:hypothetical protein
MKEVSEYIYSYFSTLPAFTAVMSARLMPVAANAETAYPFSVYNISRQVGITKECDEFTVVLSGFFKNNEYDEAASFVDAITEAVKNNSKFVWMDSEIGFIQENLSFNANVTFKIEN